MGQFYAGTPRDDQDGAGLDYDLNADYSSSTLDGGRFPAWVTNFSSVESLTEGGWTLFGDYAAGFNFAPSGYGSASPWNFGMSPEGRKRRGSTQCSSQDGGVHCETAEDLGSFVTTSSDAGSQFGQLSLGNTVGLRG